MADLARLSLNTATVQQWSLRECVEGCVQYGISAIGPWRNKVQELGLDNAIQIIEDHGLQVSGLCRAGMFTSPNQTGRQQTLNENLRRNISSCVNLGFSGGSAVGSTGISLNFLLETKFGWFL